MAKAKKLASGQWRTLVYSHTDEQGKRKYKSFTADTKKESEYLAAEFALNKKSKTGTSEITFSDCLEKYICDKECILSPYTIRGYRVMQHTLSENFKRFFETPIFQITQEDIQQLINKDNVGRTPKTIRNHHGLISAVFGVYRPDFALKTTLPQKVRPMLHIPTDDEIKRLMSAVADTELEIPTMLGAFGSMRRGEICALTIDDLDGNIIHVNKSTVEETGDKISTKPPKTFSSDRYVDLPDFVIGKIRKRGYITNLNPHSITIMFQRVLAKNNIPHFRFHDLRHYSASIQHAIGIPDAYIMRRGGWNSDGVLKSVYRHTMSDREKEMSNTANNYFNNLMQHEMQHENKKP